MMAEYDLGAVGGSDFPDQSGITTTAHFEKEEVDSSTPVRQNPASSGRKFRPKCQYAEDCYRKNPRHLKEYCHPKDADWNGADRHRPKPRCPFGEFCTRRNLRHLQYFHQPSNDITDRNNSEDLRSFTSSADDDDENARPITENDFLAVRPKVRSQGHRTPSVPNNRPQSILGNRTTKAAASIPSPPKMESEFECGCCFMDKIPISESVPCRGGHLFCRDCLRNYVKSILFGVGKSTLACLGQDCESSFSTSDMNFIDPKSMQSLEERQQQEMLALAFGTVKDERLHHCPSCDFTCLVPVSTQQFVCFQCKKESCLYCGVDWKKHMDYGYVCDEVEGDDESKIRKKTEEAMTEALVRTCPQCKAGVMKESGCNHMTCRCGFQFCYVCRQPWAGHAGGVACSQSPEAADAHKMERERVKGERERQLLGVQDRKKIGGDSEVSGYPLGGRQAYGQQPQQAYGFQRGLGAFHPHFQANSPQVYNATRHPQPYYDYGDDDEDDYYD